jgi:hypothetical protein
MKDYKLLICIDNVVLYYISYYGIKKINTNDLSYTVLRGDNLQTFDFIRNIKVYKIYDNNFKCPPNMYIYKPHSLGVKFQKLFDVQINFSKFIDSLSKNKMFFITDYKTGNNMQLNIIHNTNDIQISYMNLI